MPITSLAAHRTARVVTLCCAVSAVAWWSSAIADDAPIAWRHAYAAYGEPKYTRGFDHFDYVNPAAPKGGVLRLSNPDRRSSFDKFNPYTIKGNAPAALDI